MRKLRLARPDEDVGVQILDGLGAVSETAAVVMDDPDATRLVAIFFGQTGAIAEMNAEAFIKGVRI